MYRMLRQLCRDGKVSLLCYTGVIWSFGILYLFEAGIQRVTDGTYSKIIAPILYCVGVNVIVKCYYKGHDYQVAVRASLLGFIFALGIYVFISTPPHTNIFGVYMCVMSFFHYSEFLSIALIQPKELSTNSFLLYHSPQYVAAAIISWIEFFIECYALPELKMFRYISFVGLIICVIGEFLRKLAMITANKNFNHLVQCERAKDHVLVTHGIYSLFRHPSYVGWFYWSIGTQIILMNPFCIVAYALASWMFFNERINIEEITLLSFFGQQYCDYQQKVGTGLPLIKGYRIRP